MNKSKALRVLRNPKLVTAGVIVTFAAAGIFTLIATRAATYGTSVEAEAGTRGGAAALATDPNASGGQAVQFKTADTQPPTGGQDPFGIKQLYPTLSGGKNWVSKWNNGKARDLTGKIDPDDPWSNTVHSDGGNFSTAGDGVLKIGGYQPRLYINDPAKQDQWRNVEITMYFNRVADDGTAWGGMVAIARTSHGTIGSDNDLCDSRGIGSRVRYDGKQDYEKETAHPASSPVQSKTIDGWNANIRNKWIGYKYVVYDLPNGNVKLETYLDQTDGANGGTWNKASEFEDNGNNIGVGGTPCKGGINPAMRLTAAPTRDGSEHGKPNIAVYFRSTGVGNNGGLLYKKGSVREIAP